MDSAENIKLLSSLINKSAHNHVFVCGAISKARLGNELTDIAGLVKFGIVAISDDGSSVDREDLMLEAFKKSKENNIVVICHSEDKALSNNGVVNLGLVSTKLGLRGISRESEYKRVSRDIDLAHRAKCPVHIAHVSCKESVELISRAKTKGVKVTCETAPHYFCFNEEVLSTFDTNFKVNPPLRGKDDVLAIKEGLKNGTIDAIASDHAPHTENEKEIEFERAEFGAIGLETILSASITELVHTGLISWSELVTKLAVNPAKILGINKGAISLGQEADITIIDPDKEWILKKQDIVSKSKNSPFIGKKLKGAVEYTICSGKVVYKA
jgi:dihydroorotase